MDLRNATAHRTSTRDRPVRSFGRQTDPRQAIMCACGALRFLALPYLAVLFGTVELKSIGMWLAPFLHLLFRRSAIAYQLIGRTRGSECIVVIGTNQRGGGEQSDIT